MITTITDLTTRFRRIHSGIKKELECRFVEDAVDTSRSKDSAVAQEAEKILKSFDGFVRDRFFHRWIHCPGM